MDYSEDILEGHVGQKSEQRSVDVHHAVLIKLLAVVDGCQHQSDHLKVYQSQISFYWFYITVLTMVCSSLTLISSGSFMMLNQDLHSSALNCAHQDALYWLLPFWSFNHTSASQYSDSGVYNSKSFLTRLPISHHQVLITTHPGGRFHNHFHTNVGSVEAITNHSDGLLAGILSSRHHS